MLHRGQIYRGGCAYIGARRGNCAARPTDFAPRFSLRTTRLAGVQVRDTQSLGLPGKSSGRTTRGNSLRGRDLRKVHLGTWADCNSAWTGLCGARTVEDMPAIQHLLRRWGFVKLRRYGLELTPDGRIVSHRPVLDDGTGGRAGGGVAGGRARAREAAAGAGGVGAAPAAGGRGCRAACSGVATGAGQAK